MAVGSLISAKPHASPTGERYMIRYARTHTQRSSQLILDRQGCLAEGSGMHVRRLFVPTVPVRVPLTRTNRE